MGKLVLYVCLLTIFGGYALVGFFPATQYYQPSQERVDIATLQQKLNDIISEISGRPDHGNVITKYREKIRDLFGKLLVAFQT